VLCVFAVQKFFVFAIRHELRFNPAMEQPQPCYRPTLDPELAGERLDRLLVPGPLGDPDLERRIARLEERFRVYAASTAHGLWGPGLVLTGAMRRCAEAYLPLEEIGRAFQRLLFLSCRFRPVLPPPLFQTALSWPDVLQALRSPVGEANPARLLRRLVDNGESRRRFLFALFLPRRHGGGFDRYPVQSAFLRSRLQGTGTGGPVRCLDAACGSGEGTYELARLISANGWRPDLLTVHGSTSEPLELFAAAHGWFPHDPPRQEAFRRRIAPLFDAGAAQRITFFREDLTGDGPWGGDGYHVILCNGLLGGPLLPTPAAAEKVIGGLCARLRPGGVLLAADHFHAGWKKAVPEATLREMLAGHGLKPLDVGEGVGGVKQF
jgi:chemotaxis methyl-accepting protein methylase